METQALMGEKKGPLLKVEIGPRTEDNKFITYWNYMIIICEKNYFDLFEWKYYI
jgi:hypothetical protein